MQRIFKYFQAHSASALRRRRRIVVGVAAFLSIVLLELANMVFRVETLVDTRTGDLRDNYQLLGITLCYRSMPTHFSTILNLNHQRAAARLWVHAYTKIGFFQHWEEGPDGKLVYDCESAYLMLKLGSVSDQNRSAFEQQCLNALSLRNDPLFQSILERDWRS